MAKKNIDSVDGDEDNIEYGSGKFINKDGLLDRHDYENEDEEDEEEDNLLLGDDEDVKRDVADESDEDADEEPAASRKKKSTLKPKLIGKHSLSYDTIFKGKKNVAPEAGDVSEHIIRNAGGTLDINDDSIEGEESMSSIDSYRDLRLKDEIYKILKNNTDISFKANRRKPAKTDFNSYFALLLKELSKFGYTRTEVFIELSGYFSDNIWNMFTLLDKEYSNVIIKELKEKRGLSDMGKIDFL